MALSDCFSEISDNVRAPMVEQGGAGISLVTLTKRRSVDVGKTQTLRRIQSRLPPDSPSVVVVANAGRSGVVCAWPLPLE